MSDTDLPTDEINEPVETGLEEECSSSESGDNQADPEVSDQVAQPVDQQTSDSSSDSESGSGSDIQVESSQSGSASPEGGSLCSESPSSNRESGQVSSDDDNDPFENGNKDESFLSASATLPVEEPTNDEVVGSDNDENQVARAKSVSPTKKVKQVVGTPPPLMSPPLTSKPVRARAASALPQNSTTAEGTSAPVDVPVKQQRKLVSTPVSNAASGAVTKRKKTAASESESKTGDSVSDEPKHHKHHKDKTAGVVETPKTKQPRSVTIDKKAPKDSKKKSSKDKVEVKVKVEGAAAGKAIEVVKTKAAKVAKVVKTVKTVGTPKPAQAVVVKSGVKIAETTGQHKRKMPDPESSSSSDQSSSSESSVSSEPCTSAKIPKISNGRKYQRLAMSRAKQLGVIVSVDLNAKQVSDALKIIDTVKFKILPTHAYKYFYRVPGTTLPHARRHYRDIQKRYSEILRATVKLHLLMAQSAIRSKAGLIGPESDNEFKVLWQFSNDIARAPSTAEPLPPIPAATTPVASSSAITSSEEVESESPMPAKKRKTEKAHKKHKKSNKDKKSVSSEPDKSSRTSVKSAKTKKVKRHKSEVLDPNYLINHLLARIIS